MLRSRCDAQDDDVGRRHRSNLKRRAVHAEIKHRSNDDLWQYYNKTPIVQINQARITAKSKFAGRADLNDLEAGFCEQSAHHTPRDALPETLTRRHGRTQMAHAVARPFVVHWADVAQTGVSSLPVTPRFDVPKDRPPRLVPRPKVAFFRISSNSSKARNAYVTALQPTCLLCGNQPILPPDTGHHPPDTASLAALTSQTKRRRGHQHDASFPIVAEARRDGR